jgi:hypothetical protein
MAEPPYELVDPIGNLHVVPVDALQEFCDEYGLDRPDNIARLGLADNKWRFSQQWQALSKLRWLQLVEKKTLQPVKNVPLQPVLGETGLFLTHVACNNPRMIDNNSRVIFMEKEFSRLLGKHPPPQYKGWARVEVSIAHAREFFGNSTRNFSSGQVCTAERTRILICCLCGLHTAPHLTAPHHTAQHRIISHLSDPIRSCPIRSESIRSDPVPSRVVACASGASVDGRLPRRLAWAGGGLGRHGNSDPLYSRCGVGIGGGGAIGARIAREKAR